MGHGHAYGGRGLHKARGGLRSRGVGFSAQLLPFSLSGTAFRDSPSPERLDLDQSEVAGTNVRKTVENVAAVLALRLHFLP